MKIVEFYSLLVVFASPVFPSNLSGFRTCISNSGTGRTCQLDSGIWDVDATLVIERNGILLQGTSGDASDVILRRSSTLGANDIMYLNSGLTTTIQYLTFDGNRQTISLCASTDPGVADLNLRRRLRRVTHLCSFRVDHTENSSCHVANGELNHLHPRRRRASSFVSIERSINTSEVETREFQKAWPNYPPVSRLSGQLLVSIPG